MKLDKYSVWQNTEKKEGNKMITDRTDRTDKEASHVWPHLLKGNQDQLQAYTTKCWWIWPGQPAASWD